jgi:hypothetical protein
MRFAARLLCASILGLLAGCAERSLTVNSDPSGALVYLNGQEIGRTPLKHNFTFYGDYDVVLRKEGYETLKTSRVLKAPIDETPPLDLFRELFGARHRAEWTFTLTPASPAAVETTGLLDRANQLKGELRSSRYTKAPTTLPTTQPDRPQAGQ